MPSDASSVLRIDSTTDEVTTFGSLNATDNGYTMLEKNKWQVSFIS
jgi:hypothetical protein